MQNREEEREPNAAVILKKLEGVPEAVLELALLLNRRSKDSMERYTSCSIFRLSDAHYKIGVLCVV